MSRSNLQLLLSAHVTVSLREKFFSRVFWEYLTRKHSFLGRIFVSRFVFFNGLVVKVSNHAALRRHLPNSGWLSLTSELREFFCWNMFEFRIVTLNLRHYLMVFLCLISPDFGTCSLALHKHVLSNVIQRLSTFPRLALKTLTPGFYMFIYKAYITICGRNSILWKAHWDV